MKRILSFLKNIHSSLIPPELKNERRKKILLYVFIYSVVASTFLTIFGQLPMFTSRNLTQIFQIGWLICLIPLIMLDYKSFLRGFGIVASLLIPFLLYCLISLAFKVSSIQYSGTILVFLSLYIFLIGHSLGKYKRANIVKLISAAYILAALIYATVVFFTKLMGYDLSNQIYAFGDKNSAGPIFIVAAILAFYLFSNRTIMHFLIKWSIFVFFVVIIALSKTRAVLVAVPMIFFILLGFDIKRPFVILLICSVLLVAIIILFAVPFLYEKVIINILFNGKRTVDEIFSGRLTQIVINMQNIKPILGSGSSYFDCMPLSFLCTYGVIGFITLLPILVMPFFICFRYWKVGDNKNNKELLLVVGILFLFNSLFEGFGFIGTGAKVFALWLMVGIFFNDGLLDFRTNPVSDLPLKAGDVFSRLKKKPFVYAFYSLLTITLLSLPLFKGITSDIGSAVVDKLPSSNVIAEYKEIKDIQIDPPVPKMYVGQRITYDIKANPIDAEDKLVHWSTGWIQDPCISVDPYSGEVTAIKVGSALLHMNRFRVGQNGVYIQYPVVSKENYVFDKFHISLEKYNKSFEHTENESIVIDEGCTSKLFYDNYYVSDESMVEYISSNPSIAKVDNGLIRALSAGTSEIYAIVRNGSTNYRSVNTITVNVESNVFVPTTSISLNWDTNNLYENVPIVLNPTFNKGASDRNYSFDISGLNCNVNENKIIFTQSGLAHIKISSLNDDSIYCEYDLQVKENRPAYFECNTKQVKIGQTKSAEQLGLHLVFDNGYKKIINDSDIVFDPSDFTNRAWSDQNGLVKDRTTIKAVKPGTIHLSFVSKIDPSIKNEFDIVCSVYTEKEYLYLSSGIGLVTLTITNAIVLFTSLFVSFKRKIWNYIIPTTISALLISIIFLVYKVTSFSIASSIMVLIALASFVITFTVLNKKAPIDIIEEPVAYIKKEISNDSQAEKLTTITI